MAVAAPSGVESSDPTIGIKIKTLDGGAGFTLDVAANISIRDLKAKLQSETGLVPTRQRIIFRGKMLQENALLSDYNVEDGHALHLVARPVIPASPIVAPQPAPPDNEPPIQQLAWSEAQRRMLVNAALSSSRLNALHALRNNTRQERPTESVEHIRQGLMTINTLLSRGKEAIFPIELQFNRPERAYEERSLSSSSSSSSASARLLGSSYAASSASAKASVSSSSASLFSSRLAKRTTHTSAAAAVPSSSPNDPPTSRPEQTSKFYVGQWIDVKDTVNQWLEATVMEMSETQIFVHYNGWPNRWDEWIDKDSDRLAAFRSVTLHSPASPYMCPTPVSRLQNPPSTGSGDFRKITSDFCSVIQATSPLLEKIQTLCNASTSRDTLREQRAGIAPARGSLEETEWEYLCATARQAAPLFDRLGRLMADFAPFLHKFDSLRHDHASPRSESSVNDGMARTTSEREPAPSQPYHLGPANTPTSDPYNWLIGTSNTPPRTRPNNIDIHIHAILAPQQRSTTTASPIQPAPATHSLPSSTTISSSGPPSFTSPIRPSSLTSSSTPTQSPALDILERLISSSIRPSSNSNSSLNNIISTRSRDSSGTENASAAPAAAASASATATSSANSNDPLALTADAGSTSDSDDSDEISEESNTNSVPPHDDDRPSPCSQQLD